MRLRDHIILQKINLLYKMNNLCFSPATAGALDVLSPSQRSRVIDAALNYTYKAVMPANLPPHLYALFIMLLECSTYLEKFGPLDYMTKEEYSEKFPEEVAKKEQPAETNVEPEPEPETAQETRPEPKPEPTSSQKPSAPISFPAQIVTPELSDTGAICHAAAEPPRQPAHEPEDSMHFPDRAQLRCAS